MKRIAILALMLSALAAHASVELPRLRSGEEVLVNDYGAKGDAQASTRQQSKTIDAAAPAKGTATLLPGTYLSGRCS